MSCIAFNFERYCSVQIAQLDSQTSPLGAAILASNTTHAGSRLAASHNCVGSPPTSPGSLRLASDFPYQRRKRKGSLNLAEWFVAQVKPNADQIAKRNLEGQGFQTFQPMEKHTIAKAGRFADQIRPFFMGYLFVSYRAAAAPWSLVNST